MRKLLVNAFSLNMLSDFNSNYYLSVRELGFDVFCGIVSDLENAIGHQGTIDLINTICVTSLKTNRTEVKIGDEAILYVIQVTQRLPEGKVLSKDEIEQLLKENKVKILTLHITKVKQ